MIPSTPATTEPARPTPWYAHLYVQVLVAIVAGGMAVAVVDLLEIVEIDHDNGDGQAILGRFGEDFVHCRPEGPAVQQSGQSIGLRQETGLFLGTAAVGQFIGQFAVSPPAKQDQRDVEKQGRYQQAVRTWPIAG